MTAAEQLFLEEPGTEEVAAAEPAVEPDRLQLCHVYTEEEIRAERITEAAQELQEREFTARSATLALSAVVHTEPRRCNTDGSKVPEWLYHCRHFLYERRRKPMVARREQALTALSAAQVALLDLTVDSKELLWSSNYLPASK